MAHDVKQPACANCHYAFLPGEPDGYCPRCGQQNQDINLSFGHLLEEGLEGIFHFDSKVFRTLGLLLFRPGQLTRRFLGGQRVPYVPPVRLYVFISFMFFFVLSLQGGHGNSRKPLREEVIESLDKAEASSTAGRVEVMPGFIINTKPDSAARSRAARRPPQRAAAGPAKGAGTLAKQGGAPAQADTASRPGSKKIKFRALGLSLDRLDFAKLPENLTARQADSLLRSIGEEPTFSKRLVVRRAARWRDVTREELVHQLLRGASIMMFLLMPLAALLLKGAYFRQRRYYIGHLIFTVHLHCFAFLLLTLLNTLALVPQLSRASGLLWLAGAVYFVVALHTFYEQSWGLTLAKSVLLGGAYVLVVAASLTMVATLGLAIF